MPCVCHPPRRTSLRQASRNNLFWLWSACYLYCVILSEVGVREANANTVEGPHAISKLAEASQEILSPPSWSKCLALLFLLPTSSGSFDSVTTSPSRSSYSAQD